LAALRAGRVFVSRDPAGPQLFFDRDSQSVRVRVVGARGAVLMLVSQDGVEYSTRVASDDWSDRLRITDWAGYLRAQVLDEHGQVLALTNVLYSV
jgi:negative regulator of sigma E activity